MSRSRPASNPIRVQSGDFNGYLLDLCGVFEIILMKKMGKDLRDYEVRISKEMA